MRKYEMIVIAHPDLDDEALTALVEKVKGWIGEAKGQVEQTDIWGKRRMAYRIQKQREGQYVYLLIDVPPAAIEELERNMRLTEAIMRFMITVREG